MVCLDSDLFAVSIWVPVNQNMYCHSVLLKAFTGNSEFTKRIFDNFA
jgi:hypothetical protein